MAACNDACVVGVTVLADVSVRGTRGCTAHLVISHAAAAYHGPVADTCLKYLSAS
jgi:hypothetical protein